MDNKNHASKHGVLRRSDRVRATEPTSGWLGGCRHADLGRRDGSPRARPGFRKYPRGGHRFGSPARRGGLQVRILSMIFFMLLYNAKVRGKMRGGMFFIETTLRPWHLTCVFFNLANFSVPRQLFATTLERTGRLRMPPPCVATVHSEVGRPKRTDNRKRLVRQLLKSGLLLGGRKMVYGFDANENGCLAAKIREGARRRAGRPGKMGPNGPGSVPG